MFCSCDYSVGNNHRNIRAGSSEDRPEGRRQGDGTGGRGRICRLDTRLLTVIMSFSNSLCLMGEGGHMFGFSCNESQSRVV